MADANEKRDWRIYADVTQMLINMAKSLCFSKDFGGYDFRLTAGVPVLNPVLSAPAPGWCGCRAVRYWL